MGSQRLWEVLRGFECSRYTSQTIQPRPTISPHAGGHGVGWACILLRSRPRTSQKLSTLQNFWEPLQTSENPFSLFILLTGSTQRRWQNMPTATKVQNVQEHHFVGNENSAGCQLFAEVFKKWYSWFFFDMYLIFFDTISQQFVIVVTIRPLFAHYLFTICPLFVHYSWPQCWKSLPIIRNLTFKLV